MDEVTIDMEMVRHFYGYGRWDSPYWFIGPEQGKGPMEPGNNTLRVNAWRQISNEGMCDCYAFHKMIDEDSWHQGKPILQRTWRPLILLLKAYLNQPQDNENLRAYQRDQWGRVAEGETCVIELCGLPAKVLVSK